MTSYDDRHMLFAGKTPSQKLGFAAWLVQCVCDENIPIESMNDLTTAHGLLRTQQVILGKAAEKSQP